MVIGALRRAASAPRACASRARGARASRALPDIESTIAPDDPRLRCVRLDLSARRTARLSRPAEFASKPAHRDGSCRSWHRPWRTRIPDSSASRHRNSPASVSRSRSSHREREIQSVEEIEVGATRADRRAGHQPRTAAAAGAGRARDGTATRSSITPASRLDSPPTPGAVARASSSSKPRFSANARMDNVCHTLVGAACGAAGLNRRTRFGAATLMISANIPDVDVLVFATSSPWIEFRRGWTHGILAQIVLPIALTGFVAVRPVQTRARLGGRTAVSRRMVAGCCRSSASTRTSSSTI